jgi:protein TonB
MQPSTLSFRDRAGALSLVALVHAGVLAVLLTLAPTTTIPSGVQQPLDIFNVTLPEPTPPPPPPPVVVESKAAPKEEGVAAPPAKKAEASPINQLEPVVTLPSPPPLVVTAPQPGTGSAPAAGAAPVDGPGSGAGGQGSGTGSGGQGSGPGGGGDGGVASRPSLASRPLTPRDYASNSRRAWPSGGRVLVTFNVEVDGRASDCKVYQSIGNSAIDTETCALVLRKLRFRPARDESGRPVVSRYAYAQSALF